MIFWIDQSQIVEEERKKIFAILLRELIQIGSTFKLRIDADIHYDVMTILKMNHVHIIQNLIEMGNNYIQVEGKFDDLICTNIIETEIPAAAISGDICPYIDLEVNCPEILRLNCYDYGRTITLTENGDAQIPKLLHKTGLNMSILVRVKS